MSDLILILSIFVLPSNQFVVTYNLLTIGEAGAGKPGIVRTRTFPNSESGLDQFLEYGKTVPEAKRASESNCWVNNGPENGTIQNAYGQLVNPTSRHSVQAVENFAAAEKLGALSPDVVVRYCREFELRRTGISRKAG